MDNPELKAEADCLIDGCGLPGLLASYSAWFIGGSYSYDLMCWRDLDIYVLEPTHDLKRCFEFGYELTRRVNAKRANFRNQLGSEPHGLYWGIRLGEILEGAWKLDVWFLDEAGYNNHIAYTERIRHDLTPETKSAILAIKEALWRHPSFRKTITSDLIYRSVFDCDVRSVAEFEEFIKVKGS